MFYTKVNSILDQCLSQGKLTLFDYFNASTGTRRAGFELYVGSHGCGTNDTNYSPLNAKAENWRTMVEETTAAQLYMAKQW